MEHYAGIDVSLEQSSVCVVDAAGKIIREAKVASEDVHGPAGDDRLRRSFGGVGVSVRLTLTACEYTCGDEERELEEGSAAHDCLLTGVKVTEWDPTPVLGPSRLGSSAYGGAP